MECFLSLEWIRQFQRNSIFYFNSNDFARNSAASACEIGEFSVPNKQPCCSIGFK